MSTGLIAIILIVSTTVGLGLISGIFTVALLEGNSTQENNKAMARDPHHISRAQLRSLLIPALFLLTVGIILLIYGYSNKHPIWLSIGYGSIFFASIFLGGLLYQTNV